MLSDAADDFIELGMQKRFATAEVHTQRPKPCKVIDAANHLGSRYGFREIIVFVAIGAGEVATARRNDLYENRTERRSPGSRNHPNFPYAAFRPDCNAPQGRKTCLKQRCCHFQNIIPANDATGRTGQFSKSIKPRSTSVPSRRTEIRSPTSRPFVPRTTRPSAGGSKIRTQVPFAAAPVTIPSKCSPIREESNSAAADFRIWRSTFSAASSCLVQCSASSSSS